MKRKSDTYSGNTKASISFPRFLKYLARWQKREHEGRASDRLSVGRKTVTDTALPSAAVIPSDFDYWIAEAVKLLGEDEPDYAAALDRAQKAIGVATSDIEWAYGENVRGVALLNLGKLDKAISAFIAVAERFTGSVDVTGLGWQARALVNKGVTLGALNLSEEAIAVYDDLLARFGTATESPLREQVAKALVNKGVTLGELDRSEEAIAVYDDLLARFGTATELPLREQVARARIFRDRLQKSLQTV